MNTCPRCGTNNRPGVRFCASCGHQLQSGPAGGAPPSPASGGPQLSIQELGQAARTVPLVGTTLILGRDPSTCQIVIPNPAVSRRHAQLDYQGGSWWIEDLQSTNHTYVNGREIRRQQLHDGDIIRIGDQQGNWVGLTYKNGAASAASPVIPYAGTTRMKTTHLPQAGGVIVIGRDPASQIHLDHPSVSRQHASVVISPQGFLIQDSSSNGTFVNGQRISGAQALRVGDMVQIGPFKLKLETQGLTPFTPDGNYRLDALGLKREVFPGFIDRLRGQTSKVILNNVSLAIYPREFVALVGGSGAGKSTLMKALSGFFPAKGQVLINGDGLYENFSAYRSILGYVPQDDIIHGQLTVQTALSYAARLRLPDASPVEITQRVSDVLSQVEMTPHVDKEVRSLSGGQRKRVSIAVELLADPGLFFLDEPTSGLDPGLEKKMMYTMRQLADQGRTIVLVTHATANITQCTHVAFMADGRLVYFGPPQEALTFFGANDFSDIYTQIPPFQRIGPNQPNFPPQLAPAYNDAVKANSQNPATTAAELWAECFKRSPAYQQYVAGRLPHQGQAVSHPISVQTKSSQKVSWLQQFWVLTRRYFDLVRRDMTSFLFLLMVMPLIALLLTVIASSNDFVGYRATEPIREIIQPEIKRQRENQVESKREETFQASYVVVDDAQRLLFIMALAVTLLGLFGAAYEIVKEDPIYTRERMVNLKIVPYLLSKVTILGFFALFQCGLLLFFLKLDLIFPASDEGVLFAPLIEMYLTLFLATLAGITMGLLISALVRSSDTVIYIVLLVLFFQIIFAGAIFDLPEEAAPLSYLTTTRWTLEALGNTLDMDGLNALGVTCVEFEDEQQRNAQKMQNEDQAQGPCTAEQMNTKASYDLTLDYRHETNHLLTRWGMLAAFSLAFWLATIAIQRRKDIV
jgi:ABC-type multidrug transport system ATPase subunit/pSer/pThr/pTyr-binding forkhead associated (FHA) protein